MLHFMKQKEKEPNTKKQYFMKHKQRNNASRTNPKTRKEKKQDNKKKTEHEE